MAIIALREDGVMTAGVKKVKLLDTKRCWKDWMRLGSLNKVRSLLEINPQTMKLPTPSGIEKAAFRWALTNQTEARKDLAFAWQEIGMVLTDEDWKKFLVDKAGLIHYDSPGRLHEFLVENELLQYA